MLQDTQTRCFPVTTTVSDTASQPEGFMPVCDLLGTACTGHILHQGICITNLGSQAPKRVCNVTTSFDEHLYTLQPNHNKAQNSLYVVVVLICEVYD